MHRPSPTEHQAQTEPSVTHGRAGLTEAWSAAGFPLGEYTQATMRTLQVLEALAFAPASAPMLAERLQVTPRTTRRMLRALHAARYVEQRTQSGADKYQYTATPRLLTLAAQLSRHHPVLDQARQQVGELAATTGLSAWAVTPAHDGVVVVASEGPDAPTLWAVLPVKECAAGEVLLAYDHRWRQQLGAGEHEDRTAALTRQRGYVLKRDADPLASLAVVAGTRGEPEIAVVVTGPLDRLRADETATAEAVRAVAAKMQE